MSDSRPPLRARLHWYKLEPSEFCLLTAMCEHNSDGSLISAALPRLAAYSKLSLRTVKYIIHDLLARKILAQLTPANARNKRQPARYAINEWAMVEDPDMEPYRSNQLWLPGATGANSVTRPEQNLHVTGAMVAPNSKSIDSRTIEIQESSLSEVCKHCGRTRAFNFGSHGFLCGDCVGRVRRPE